MKFYDAHIHFLFDHSEDELEDTFAYLEKIGLAGFVSIVIAEYPSNIKSIQDMVPEAYHQDVTFDSLERQKQAWLQFRRAGNLEILLYLDARFIERDIKEKIQMYRRLGFVGIKLLYVPEQDPVLEIGGMQQAFGRSRAESERVASFIVESGEDGPSIAVYFLKVV